MKIEQRINPLKEVRKQKFLPGIFYGKGIESVPVQVNYQEFIKAYQKYRTNMTFSINLNNEEHIVYIKEVQVSVDNYLLLTHFDLLKVSSTDTIVSKMPLVFHNKDEASKGGFILNINLYEIEVEYLVGHGVSNIEVDLKDLTLETAFYVKDVVISEGITLLENPDEVVASLSRPALEVEETTDEDLEVIEQDEEEAVDEEN